MRRFVAFTALAAVTLLLGFGPAASAQTNTTLPLAPGQGGPDNSVNSPTPGNNAGGPDNPAVDAGPAVGDGDDDSSIAPWLIGAAMLVVLTAGAAVLARKATSDRREANRAYSA